MVTRRKLLRIGATQDKETDVRIRERVHNDPLDAEVLRIHRADDRDFRPRVPGDPRLPTDRRDAWLNGLKAGASIATNGPLVGLAVNGQYPGSRIALAGEDLEVRFEGFLRSTFDVAHLEIVLNGKVIESFDKADGQTSASISGSIAIEESGWLLLRAWSDKPHGCR